jgi:two-component system sensor kinase FixL
MSGMPAPQRLLSVSTAWDGDHARVCVTDTGQGIAPAQMPMIFEPFFTTKKNGLGMGLAICANIVASHGGALTAANNETSGATFCFTLPAAREQTGTATAGPKVQLPTSAEADMFNP